MGIASCLLTPMHGTLVMMQVVCQDKKVVVAEAKTSCEQLLVAIVQDKRIADEQERQVRPLDYQYCHSLHGLVWLHLLQ